MDGTCSALSSVSQLVNISGCLRAAASQVWLRIVTGLIGVGVFVWFAVTILYLRRAWSSLAVLPYSSYRLANLIVRVQVRTAYQH